MDNLQKEEEMRKERFMQARGGSVGTKVPVVPEHEWNPDYPAQEMHIKFLKEVIKTQKEQIDELNNSLEMYRFLESGEEEHE